MVIFPDSTIVVNITDIRIRTWWRLRVFIVNFFNNRVSEPERHLCSHQSKDKGLLFKMNTIEIFVIRKRVSLEKCHPNYRKLTYVHHLQGSPAPPKIMAVVIRGMCKALCILWRLFQLFAKLIFPILHTDYTELIQTACDLGFSCLWLWNQCVLCKLLLFCL